MTSTTHTMSGNASRLEALLNAAHKEPELKREFLADPVGVATHRNVQLDEQDADRLRKLGIFAELAREARVGSLFRVGDPRVWYATQFWLQQEVLELISELAYPDCPSSEFRDNGLGKLREALAHRISGVRQPAGDAASGDCRWCVV